jgi:CarD family transcriptional regulator
LRDRAKGLSAGEKSLYTKARNVLISELAFALDVDEDSATERIDNVLA